MPKRKRVAVPLLSEPITKHEFGVQYAKTHSPVLLQGASMDWFAPVARKWGEYEYLKEKADESIRKRCHVRRGILWILLGYRAHARRWYRMYKCIPQPCIFRRRYGTAGLILLILYILQLRSWTGCTAAFCRSDRFSNCSASKWRR